MLQVLIALVLAVVGLLMEGLVNLSLAATLLLLAIPCTLLYKIFGNRPSYLVFAAIVGTIGGGIAAFWGYVVVPIQYYHSVWGWGGVVAGVIAALLLPLEFVLFFAVAYFKGSATIYIGKFLAGICFGFSSLFLFNGAFAKSPWSWLSKRKRDPDAA